MKFELPEETLNALTPDGYELEKIEVKNFNIEFFWNDVTITFSGIKIRARKPLLVPAKPLTPDEAAAAMADFEAAMAEADVAIANAKAVQERPKPKYLYHFPTSPTYQWLDAADFQVDVFVQELALMTFGDKGRELNRAIFLQGEAEETRPICAWLFAFFELLVPKYCPRLFQSFDTWGGNWADGGYIIPLTYAEADLAGENNSTHVTTRVYCSLVDTDSKALYDDLPKFVEWFRATKGGQNE